MKKLLIALVCYVFVLSLEAQEFRCNVQVTSPSVQGTNKKVFETLQTSIVEFMNGQKWTEHVFAPEERIEMNVLINIKEVVSVDEFKGTMQVQARRPVYGASYSTVLFNYLESNFHIRYVEYEPLVYNPNNFESNLVGLLAYYSYVVLGMDYDSFSMLGGTPYFQKAEQIVSRAQSAAQKGWKSYENKKNRYWLIENALNEYHKPLRECFYKYHRLGLDVMGEKMDGGRSEIARSLELLRKVHRQKPGSFFMQIFFDAKSSEIVNVFSESPSMERGRVVELLKEVNPSNSSEYDKLLSGKN